MLHSPSEVIGSERENAISGSFNCKTSCDLVADYLCRAAGTEVRPTIFKVNDSPSLQSAEKVTARLIGVPLTSARFIMAQISLGTARLASEIGPDVTRQSVRKIPLHTFRPQNIYLFANLGFCAFKVITVLTGLSIKQRMLHYLPWVIPNLPFHSLDEGTTDEQTRR